MQVLRKIGLVDLWRVHLTHSVLKVHLDSRHSRNELEPELSEHPVPVSTPSRVVGFYDNQSVRPFGTFEDRYEW